MASNLVGEVIMEGERREAVPAKLGLDTAIPRASYYVNNIPVAPERRSLKRSLFDFFNSGSGARALVPLIDLHYQIWKRWHGKATFAEYYAGSIAQKLRHGGTHKALGAKTFLSGSLFSTAKDLSTADFRKRGLNFFAAAIDAGLQPHHVCIDYGCGSLRVGQHLLDYLDPGNYWGLDIIDDFFEAGKTLLPKSQLECKIPRFRVISPTSLDEAKTATPQFIVSFSVMRHVPPLELATYLGNIISLMGRETKVLISFTNRMVSARIGAKIWSYSEADILEAVYALDPSIQTSFGPLYDDKRRIMVRNSLVFLTRRT